MSKTNEREWLDDKLAKAPDGQIAAGVSLEEWRSSFYAEREARRIVQELLAKAHQHEQELTRRLLACESAKDELRKALQEFNPLTGGPSNVAYSRRASAIRSDDEYEAGRWSDELAKKPRTARVIINGAIRFGFPSPTSYERVVYAAGFSLDDRPTCTYFKARFGKEGSLCMERREEIELVDGTVFDVTVTNKA